MSALSEDGLAARRWEALPDAVLVADQQSRYLDANPAALKLLGYTLPELRARTVADIVAHGAAWTAAEYERFTSSGTWEGRLVLRTKSQALVVVEARAAVVRQPHGLEYLSVLRDAWIPALRPEPSPPAEEPSLPDVPLTRRERQVIALIADGSSSAQIAAHLGISPRTADTHRHRIMRKLGVGSIAALTRFALRHGLTRAE